MRHLTDLKMEMEVSSKWRFVKSGMRYTQNCIWVSAYLIKCSLRGWEIFKWEGRVEILAHTPSFWRQLLGCSSGTKEPNRREAVLGFSLQHDTYCGRVQLGLLKTSLQQRSPGLILRQLPYGSFQQTAATASSFFLYLGQFPSPFLWRQAGETVFRYFWLLDPEKGSGSLFEEQELSVSLYIEEKKIILMIQGKNGWGCPFPFLHINYKSWF